MLRGVAAHLWGVVSWFIYSKIAANENEFFSPPLSPSLHVIPILFSLCGGSLCFFVVNVLGTLWLSISLGLD